jgi:phosphatidylglycerophosphate synthase
LEESAHKTSTKRGPYHNGRKDTSFERFEALARKPPYTYMEVVFSKLSIRLSYLLSYTSVTPNQLTVVSVLLALISAGLILQPDYDFRILGIVVWFLAWLLDDCDGQIARYKCMETEFGHWFDEVTDRVKDVGLFTGVTLLAVRQTGSIEASLWGLLALGGTIVYQYAATYHFKSVSSKATRFSPAKFGSANYVLMAVLLALDLPQLFLTLVTIVTFSGLGVDIYLSRNAGSSRSSQTSSE